MCSLKRCIWRESRPERARALPERGRDGYSPYGGRPEQQALFAPQGASRCLLRCARYAMSRALHESLVIVLAAPSPTASNTSTSPGTPWHGKKSTGVLFFLCYGAREGDAGYPPSRTPESRFSVSFSWVGRLCTRKHTISLTTWCVFVCTASPSMKKRLPCRKGSSPLPPSLLVASHRSRSLTRAKGCHMHAPESCM